MRFVRAYYKAGVCIAVAEQETPFTGPALLDVEADEVEVGLVEDFDAQGAAPSKRLFECMSKGAPLPAAVIDCPTSLDGIVRKLRVAGPSAVHERALHWLYFVGVLSDDQIAAFGHRRIPIAVAAEFDAMRGRRDPSAGSRIELFKRALKSRALERANRRRPSGMKKAPK